MKHTPPPEHEVHKQKKTVVIAIIVAVVSLIALLAYVFFVIPSVERALFSQYPEIKEVSDTIKTKYPKGNIDVYVNYQTVAGENGKTTSHMTVTYSGPELGEKEIRDIGALTCGELTQMNKNYDKVVVLVHKPILPFPIPGLQLGKNNAYPGSCKK